MQDCRTSEMVFPIPVLILEEFARWYTFQPGDIVTCGTPAGCGFNRTPQIFLVRGGVVSIRVDGRGVLEHPVGCGGLEPDQSRRVWKSRCRKGGAGTCMFVFTCDESQPYALKPETTS